MSDLTGHVLLGRYRVTRFLGQGGMARVYKAWDDRRSYHVAIKVLRDDLAANRDFVERFRREAAVLEVLRHPNIVRYYGFEESGDQAFLVLEYIEGESLRVKMTGLREPLTMDQALAILEPVCKALHFAHEEGIYHCDVKPANILIENNQRVVLADFGIARMAGIAGPGGATMGAPAYMSPEQCRGEHVDRRTDVYALGLTLYEMLTLDRPFRGVSTATPGSTAERIRWEHIHCQPKPPRILNANIAPQIEATILMSLSKERESRQETVMAFLQELASEQTAQTGMTLPLPDGGKKRSPQPERQLDRGKEEVSVWQRLGFVPPKEKRRQQGRGGFLRVLRGEMSGSTFRVGREGLTIGRAAGNNIRLHQRSVSRRHAAIKPARGEFYLQDRNSTHGTFVNGSPVQAVKLKDGDVITIGYTEFEFRTH